MATLIETVQLMKSRGWTAFVFGGTPRGVYDNGRSYQPRDLDLVFDDEDFLSFESAFDQYIIRTNSYGGLRLNVNGLSIDAWSLGNTWAFREGRLKNPSFENLPATTFLNVDGIVVELNPRKGKGRRVYERGFFNGWQQKTLDINLRENPHPPICVVRTLYMSKRFGFRLSQRLAKYLYEMLEKFELVQFEKAQLKHYGNIEFSIRALMGIQLALEDKLAVNSLFPISIFPVRPEQLELGAKSNNRGAQELRNAPVPCKEDKSVWDDSTDVEQWEFVGGLFQSVLEK